HQHRDHGSFGSLHECQRALPTKVNQYKISLTDLTGSDQVRHREDKMPFNGTLQVTRPVTVIGPLAQQEILHVWSAREHELVRSRGHQDALLYHPKFDFQNLLQVLRTQRLENHDL